MATSVFKGLCPFYESDVSPSTGKMYEIWLVFGQIVRVKTASILPQIFTHERSRNFNTNYVERIFLITVTGSSFDYYYLDYMLK